MAMSDKNADLNKTESAMKSVINFSFWFFGFVNGMIVGVIIASLIFMIK
jgi:MFS superfamily sulfate permease-like transporter